MNQDCADRLQTVEQIAEVEEVSAAADSLPRPDHRYFANCACQYFPCHAGADPDRFNCLFCYCPLYALGSRCGGNFRWTTKGYKDCTECLFPHRPENYDKVISRYKEIAEVVRRFSDDSSDRQKCH